MVGDVFEGDGAGRHTLLDRQCVASGRRGNDSCPLQFGIVKTAGVNVDTDRGMLGTAFEVAVDLANHIGVLGPELDGVGPEVLNI